MMVSVAAMIVNIDAKLPIENSPYNYLVLLDRVLFYEALRNTEF